jgi:hypothetical protein
VLAPFDAHGSLALFPFLNLFEADERPCNGQSIIGCLMASFAEKEGLSLEGYHSLDPLWFWSSWVLMELFHCSHMMYFYIFTCPTEFTEICKQALYEFCSTAIELRWLVLQGCLDIPL